MYVPPRWHRDTILFHRGCRCNGHIVEVGNVCCTVLLLGRHPRLGAVASEYGTDLGLWSLLLSASARRVDVFGQGARPLHAKHGHHDILWTPEEVHPRSLGEGLPQHAHVGRGGYHLELQVQARVAADPRHGGEDDFQRPRSLIWWHGTRAQDVKGGRAL